MNEDTVPLLLLYMRSMRKHVKPDWQLGDALFLNFDGTPMDDRAVGALYSHFMSVHFNRRFTTTNYRSLVQTSAHEARVAGVLSEAEKSSFDAVNGHTSSVCRQFYIKDRMVKAANTALVSMGKLRGVATADAPLELSRISTLVPYGTNHSQDEDVVRARWDPEELYEVTSCLHV